MKLKLCIVLGIALFLAAVAIAYSFVQRHRMSLDSQQMAAAAEHPGETHLWHCGMHTWVIQDHPGDCPVCHMKLTPMNSDSAAQPSAGQRKLLYYWDPMLGPSSISNKPGKSAMNMDLVPVYADAAGPAVTIDPTIIQNMGVRTAEVTRGPLIHSVRTVGIIKSPESGMHDVSVKVAGWIERLDANEEGMHVAKGDVLFELYSQDLQVAEAELISAIKSEQSLSADATPAIRQEALALVESAKRKFRLWDVAEEDIDAIAKSPTPPRDVPFRSPASGHMIEKMVVQGTAVQPGSKIMRIEDHTKMWLDAQVYESQLPMVQIGQEVTAAVDGIPGKTFKGAINFIFPHFDHATRTISARITLDNPDFRLKPGMYATAEILTQPVNDAIQVPREAVIDTGVRQIAFVADGQGHFEPRKVTMGIIGDDDRVQITQGLAAGEMVVTSGQFLMDVESRTTEAINKLRKKSAGVSRPTE
jgi:Cu(I)/Ag(I) efflux system membrane fusion protein/cobalt-zinc-cadmium efflux system membrane fusion protein